LIANRYESWSSRGIEELLLLDRKQGFVDEELKGEFDHRCTKALEQAFEELGLRYPNVVLPRGRRKDKPPGSSEG